MKRKATDYSESLSRHFYKVKMKQKKQFKLKCPDCEKEIIGFSEHHAQQNLMIHTKTSEKCREFRELLRKRGLK